MGAGATTHNIKSTAHLNINELRWTDIHTHTHIRIRYLTDKHVITTSRVSLIHAKMTIQYSQEHHVYEIYIRIYIHILIHIWEKSMADRIWPIRRRKVNALYTHRHILPPLSLSPMCAYNPKEHPQWWWGAYTV